MLDANGIGLPGVTVRVWADGWPGVTVASDSKPVYGPGGWEVALDDHPKDGVWKCQVIGPYGALLSEVVGFETYGEDCARNLVLIAFKKTS